MRAQAQAAAIRIIAEALGGAHSDEAAKLAVAREVCMLCATVVCVLYMTMPEVTPRLYFLLCH